MVYVWLLERIFKAEVRKINRWLVMSIRCTLFQQQPLLQRACFLALYIPDETYAERQMTRDHRGFKYIWFFKITFKFFNNRFQRFGASKRMHPGSSLTDPPRYGATRSHYNRYHCWNMCQSSQFLKRWHWQRKCQPSIYSGSWRAFATVHNVDWTTVRTSRIPIGTVQL